MQREDADSIQARRKTEVKRMSQLDREMLQGLPSSWEKASELTDEAIQKQEQLRGAVARSRELRAQFRSPNPHIHIVDDDVPFATSICRVLRTAGFSADQYHSAGDFLLANKPDAPGCILLDVCLPGPSGLQLQEALVKAHEALPVIFLSGCSDVPTTVRAIKGGALDFLTKPVDRDELLAAVNIAITKSEEMRFAQVQLRRRRQCFERLTPRETQVFEAVVAGKMNKEIASELGAAERTIKAHRAQVMQKMQVCSVADLVRVSEDLKNNGNHRASI